MKFFELKLLFSEEIARIRKDDAPQIRYIIIAYNNVLNAIKNTYDDKETVTKKKINDLQITDHMKNKLELMAKQTVPNSIKKQQKENKLFEELNELLGIGEKKAQELIEHGLTNINQLKQKKWFEKLNKDSQMMIEHRPLRHIPHGDIKRIESKITGFDDNIIISGSYRRNKPFCRDIDILFLSKSKTYIDKYLSYLEKYFNIWTYAAGPNKISTIIQYKKEENKYKADIFIADKTNYYSALLYTTGSKDFNVKQRSRAKKLGYLLNQDGIFKDGKKINKSTDDEHALFKILKMPYVLPEYRI